MKLKGSCCIFHYVGNLILHTNKYYTYGDTSQFVKLKVSKLVSAEWGSEWSVGLRSVSIHGEKVRKKILQEIWFVFWGGLTPQQQPGPYRGGGCDDEMSVSLVEETGVPRGNHRPIGGIHTLRQRTEDVQWQEMGQRANVFIYFLFFIY